MECRNNGGRGFGKGECLGGAGFRKLKKTVSPTLEGSMIALETDGPCTTRSTQSLLIYITLRRNRHRGKEMYNAPLINHSYVIYDVVV